MRERSPVACRAAGASALRGTQSRRRAQGQTPIPHSEANRELFPRGRRHFTTQWWAVTRGPTSEHTELRISARKEITVFQRKKEYDPSGCGETFFFFNVCRKMFTSDYPRFFEGKTESGHQHYHRHIVLSSLQRTVLEEAHTAGVSTWSCSVGLSG